MLMGTKIKSEKALKIFDEVYENFGHADEE